VRKSISESNRDRGNKHRVRAVRTPHASSASTAIRAFTPSGQRRRLSRTGGTSALLRASADAGAYRSQIAAYQAAMALFKQPCTCPDQVAEGGLVLPARPGHVERCQEEALIGPRPRDRILLEDRIGRQPACHGGDRVARHSDSCRACLRPSIGRRHPGPPARDLNGRVYRLQARIAQEAADVVPGRPVPVRVPR